MSWFGFGKTENKNKSTPKQPPPVVRRVSSGPKETPKIAKVKEEQSNKQDTMFGGLAVKENGKDSQKAAAPSNKVGLFDNLDVKPAAPSIEQESAKPPSPKTTQSTSAFSFVSSSSNELPKKDIDTTTEETIPESKPSTELEKSGVATETKSSFGFLSSNNSSTNPTKATDLLNSQPVDLLSGTNTVQPTKGIKKKRGGLKPGFARRESTNSTMDDDASTTKSSRAILEPTSQVANVKTMNQREESTKSEKLESLEQHPKEQPSGNVKSSMFDAVGLTVKDNSTSVNESKSSMFDAAGLTVKGNSNTTKVDESISLDASSMVDITSLDDGSNEYSSKQLSKKTEKRSDPVANMVPKDGFEKILIDFHVEAENFINNLNDLEASFATAGNEMSLLESKYDYVKIQLAQSEKQQEEATITEDFEQAERLQQSIDSYTRDLGMIENNLKRITSERESFELKRITVFDDELKCIQGATELLSDYSDAKTKEAETFLSNALSEYETKKKEIGEREEILALDRENVTKDLGIIVGEKEIIQRKIDDKTTRFRGERTEWEEKRELVEMEIQALLKQLEEKQKIKEEYDNEIAVLDDSIKSIETKFGTRLVELKERERGIKEKQSKLEESTTLLQSDKEQAENKKQEAIETASDMKVSATAVDKQLKIVDHMVQRLLQDQTARREQSSELTQETDAIEDMRGKYVILQQGVDMLEKQVSQIDTSIMEKRRTIIDIDSIIPGMNEQKSMAVSTRNFKEAGALASKIKEMTAKKEKVQSELDSALEQKELVSTQLQQKKAGYDSLSLELKNRESKVNSDRLELVQKKRKQLKVQMDDIQSAGDTKGSPISFGATLLLLLNAEADSCKVEAEELATKLGDVSLSTLETDSIMDDETPQQEEEYQPPAITVPSTISKAEDVVVLDEHNKIESAKKALELHTKVNAIEEEIIEAVEAEDFEKAGDLDQVKTDLEQEMNYHLEICGGMDEAKVLSVQESSTNTETSELNTTEHAEMNGIVQADDSAEGGSVTEDLLNEVPSTQSDAVPDNTLDVEEDVGSENEVGEDTPGEHDLETAKPAIVGGEGSTAVLTNESEPHEPDVRTMEVNDSLPSCVPEQGDAIEPSTEVANEVPSNQGLFSQLNVKNVEEPKLVVEDSDTVTYDDDCVENEDVVDPSEVAAENVGASSEVVEDNVDTVVANDSAVEGEIVEDIVDTVVANDTTVEGEIVEDIVDTVVANDTTVEGEVEGNVDTVVPNDNTVEGEVVEDNVDTVVLNDTTVEGEAIVENGDDSIDAVEGEIVADTNNVIEQNQTIVEDAASVDS